MNTPNRSNAPPVIPLAHLLPSQWRIVDRGPDEVDSDLPTTHASFVPNMKTEVRTGLFEGLVFAPQHGLMLKQDEPSKCSMTPLMPLAQPFPPPPAKFTENRFNTVGEPLGEMQLQLLVPLAPRFVP
jgi:hypothetical protein